MFTKVEQPPAFPGGEKAFEAYMAEVLSPKDLLKTGVPKGRYNVAVQFIVNKAGKLSYLKALINEGYGLEQMVIRLLEQGLLWIPAKRMDI